MVDFLKILRLKRLGYTMKDIASSVHSSRNTVSDVLTLAGNQYQSVSQLQIITENPIWA